MNYNDKKLISVAPILLLLIYLLVTGFGLNRYPLVWVDEGWIGEVAAQAARGLPLGSPSHGTLYRYSDRLFWMPPLYFYELGGAFRVGGVDLMVGRWFNVFVGGLSTLALFIFLRRRTGLAPAIAAALFFAFDTFVWKTHRTIRFESLLTLFGILLFIAVTLALDREEDDRPARGAWVASGVVAGLALNVHPNALLLILAVAGMGLVRRGPRLFRMSGPWLALAAAAALALPYVMYLGTDAAAGFANVIGQNSFHLDHGVAAGPAPLREWRRWADFFVAPARLPAMAAWATLIVIALSRFGRAGAGAGAADRRLTASALTMFGIYVTVLVMLPNKTLLYLSCVAPFVAMLGASLWGTGTSGEGRGSDEERVFDEERVSDMERVTDVERPGVRPPLVAYLARTAVVGGVVASLAVNAGLLWRHRDCRATEDLARIRAVLTPNDRVAGTFVTWWATQPAAAAEPARPFHEFSRGATLGDVAAFAPSVIILDDRQWLQEVPTRFGPLDRALRAADGPLAEREPVEELPGSCLGPVGVYLLRR